MTTVWPNSVTARRRKPRISAPERESRLPVGSSAKTICGRLASARAGGGHDGGEAAVGKFHGHGVEGPHGGVAPGAVDLGGVHRGGRRRGGRPGGGDGAHLPCSRRMASRLRYSSASISPRA